MRISDWSSDVCSSDVLGSAQILMEYHGERIVVTGDYKRRPDPTCARFEVVPCDIFVTEATFGLPVFRHPPTSDAIAKLVGAVRAEPDRSEIGRASCRERVCQSG